MKTEMRYVARCPVFATEKAFTTDFFVDHVEGARRTNHEVDDREIEVAPIEDRSYWELDKHGFCVLHAPTQVDTKLILEDKTAVQDDLWYQFEAILHDRFPQYARIEAFDLTVRKRDDDFPEVTRVYRNEWEQPATTAHCDYSRGGSYKILSHAFQGQDAYWADKEFDILNVWRPLNGPTDDWPLVFCDWNTIDKNSDILLNDAVRRDMVDESSLLHYSEAHRWHYLTNHLGDDLLVFRSANSHERRARGFHAAVSNPLATGPPRQSVEARLVAFYHQPGEEPQEKQNGGE